jgi:hypothetical protein
VSPPISPPFECRGRHHFTKRHHADQVAAFHDDKRTDVFVRHCMHSIEHRAVGRHCEQDVAFDLEYFRYFHESSPPDLWLFGCFQCSPANSKNPPFISSLSNDSNGTVSDVALHQAEL